MENIPKVSVIMPALNEQDHIAICLQSLHDQDYPNNKIQIILVDNGSTDKTVAIASEFAVKVVSITDVLVGAVRNYGAKLSDGEILAFLDADCLVDSNWLARGVKILQDATEDVVIGGGWFLRENAIWLERYWLLENNGKPSLPKDLLGSNIMLSRKTFQQIGGFNENVSSGEDTELSFELKRNGIKVLICHEFNVTHLGNKTTIPAFVKRQLWHSENYIQEIRNSIVDPVFWLVSLYLLSWITLIACLFINCKHWNIVALTVLAIPAILSIKRLKRARMFRVNPLELVIIYFIDVLYLLGRIMGLLKGTYIKFLNYMKPLTTKTSK